MLNQIVDKFLNSSLKVKIQLYILVILCIYFYTYLFEVTNNKKTSNNNQKIEELLNKRFNESFLDITSELEEYFKAEGINISSITYRNKELSVKGKTTLKKIENLIKKIENLNNFSKISSLSITKTDQYIFHINTEFKKYYIKKFEKITNIKKVKEKHKEVIKKNNNKELKLRAIISKYILINDDWYHIEDKVGKYKIIDIKDNEVILNYKGKDMNLRLYKDE